MMNERLLKNRIKDGCFLGKRGFVVGGGPSLCGFDWEQLNGEVVIGVNRVYEKIDPTFVFTIDSRFAAWAHSGRYGPTALKKYQESKAVKVLSRRFNPASEKRQGWWIVRRTGVVYGASIERGITAGNNSGFGAIGLGIALGLNPIYLLGFDFGSGGGAERQKRWWHDGHPVVSSAENCVYDFQEMVEEFEKYAPHMKRYTRIINCNLNSNLRCFEFGGFLK